MNADRLVHTYHDIGFVLETDYPKNTAAKMNTIVHSTFIETSGYEYYTEMNIMKNFKLEYTLEDNAVKGSIACMIVMRKCEL